MVWNPRNRTPANFGSGRRPERHRMIALAAAREGKSINAWVDETLAEAAGAGIRGSSAHMS